MPYPFLSVATGRSQRTKVLPALLRFMCLSVCCQSVVVGTDKNSNFSAVRSPIGLKLSGDLGYPRLACMFWFQDLFIFYIVNKQRNKEIAEIAKMAVLQNLRFLRCAESD
jgi:hypothetical protein